ncbi:MAG: hypothetical protein K6F04_00555, partial [bacterium]|nr:hypothetical protein [bacterium]
AYKKYSNICYNIPKSLQLRNNKKITKTVSKIKKHFRRVWGPISVLFKIIDEVISTVFYIIKLPLDILVEGIKIIK